MGRLTLGQRIGAVSCLVLLTVGIALFYFIAKGFSKDIAFTVQEQEGNQYQRPLEDLLQGLTEHELVARQAQGGHTELQGSLAPIEQKIDAALVDLQAVDAKFGVDLQFTDEGLAKRKRDHYRWQTVKKEWAELKSQQTGQSAEASDKLHEHLIADVRMMIQHAGDTSNLILDSDLDSYYLMDATLVTIPQTQDRLSTIAKLGQDGVGNGSVSEEHRMGLAVAAALLNEGDLARVQGDVQTSLNEDQNFHGTSKGLQKNLPPAMDEYTKANQTLLDLMQKIAASPDATASQADYSKAVNTARSASFRLWQVSAEELNTLLQMRVDDLASQRMWALICTALALALTAGIAFVVFRRSIQEFATIATELEEGAVQVSAAAMQVAATCQLLAEGASEQAASIEETLSSSDGIKSSARKNTDNSHAMTELVGSSQVMFAQTNRRLEEAVSSMDEINQSSGKISKIIKVIDEIAFQTNILALNAAVEAARAGDAGMGFAVVAEEVRNLAQRSAQAAMDTSELIQDSIAKSNSGKARVDQVVDAIHSITANSDKIKTLVDEVTAGSKEQSRGLDEIAGCVTQIDAVTQSTAASAEQSAAAAEELSAQSEALRELVARLNTAIGSRANSQSGERRDSLKQVAPVAVDGRASFWSRLKAS